MFTKSSEIKAKMEKLKKKEKALIFFFVQLTNVEKKYKGLFLEREDHWPKKQLIVQLCQVLEKVSLKLYLQKESPLFFRARKIFFFAIQVVR